MNVFELRDNIIGDYEAFTRSFACIRSRDIREFLDAQYDRGRFWPQPLIQLNPRFVPGKTVEELSRAGVLHPECARIFRRDKGKDSPGETLVLHRHQEEAIELARRGVSYVLTTGTGSGKSLSYFIPIVDHVLRRKEEGAGPGIQAIVVYPMNALANSQLDELEKFLRAGYPPDAEPVTFGLYTGQEDNQAREAMAANPPDILLTNFMMLELIMTRLIDTDQAIIRHARGLRFLVLDELHTYRGRQGADVALLVRRVREALNPDLICVGTSATMASEGDRHARNEVVAEVATRLFGQPVEPEHVVTESLMRVTDEAVQPSPAALADAIRQGVPNEQDDDALRRHPVAVWIETTMGLQREGDAWVRTRPLSLEEAARRLAKDSGLDLKDCQPYLRAFLLLAWERRLFAFRLHQFISGAGDLFSTLEPEGERYLDLSGQQVQPGHRNKRLFNVAFCRQCGQEYHPVWACEENGTLRSFEPRELDDRSSDDDEAGFGLFMPDPHEDWNAADIDNYPELWIEHVNGEPRIKSYQKKYVPRLIQVDTDGNVVENGLRGWYLPGNMRFCLRCGTSYHAHSKESSRLSSLSSEGRSSATTILTLSALRHMLMEAPDLPEEARKILAFTDNRQDASLQAGHFNDFVQILLLRGALLAAARQAADTGVPLRDDNLTQAVFRVLGFDSENPAVRREYMSNPDAVGMARRRAEEAMRNVLGYRLYFDLRRGWRFTNPNLEQLGLLAIDYQDLGQLARDSTAWTHAHPLLVQAAPEIRKDILRRLLDVFRQNLCLKTRYLDPHTLEQIRQASHSHLREPWGLTEEERLEAARVLVPGPGPRRRDDPRRVPLSSRSAFGKTLKKPSTWGGASAAFPEKFDESAFQAILADLVESLQHYGLLEPVQIEKGVTGYQLVADSLVWTSNEREEPEQAGDCPANRYFRALYRNVAAWLEQGERLMFRLEAREHTAQVDADDRKKREERFREAQLPVLFCSPTMELGVDIAKLNTVYMRNVPPTPANYAQRGGRAGRSGQPALVLTYCAARSPHDQYFFRDPVRMVQGQVRPPTLDLANEDLIRSHLHALWLRETGVKLADSINHVLDMNQPDTMPVRKDLAEQLNSEAARNRARARADHILAMLAGDLRQDTAPWFHDQWLDHVMAAAYRNLDRALDRWRTLYASTVRQMQEAHAIQINPAASEQARQEARRRYDEARTQQNLLLQSRPVLNSDFYTYRYLASQGFLPGYNFPRLPLLAYIPARRQKIGRDSFLSRPRFLALSEFGPQSIIYHEGSQYRVRKVIIGTRDSLGAEGGIGLPTTEARLCPACGYGHFDDERNRDRCLACNAPLEGGKLLTSLYRIENVSTRRVTRITSDEEDQIRQGYEMQTTLRFAQVDGRMDVVKTAFHEGEDDVLRIQYAPAATVWRINLGWRRRKEKSLYGFHLDVTTGNWCGEAQGPGEDGGDPHPGEVRRVHRVVPYVEDRRNVLVVQPVDALDEEAMVTLQHALKRGIETVFQIEESELMAEPLPDREHRHRILFYEAAEGGAGVLTRLASDPRAMRRVAAAALEVLHYRSRDDDWRSGDLEDTGTEACEKGCYRCLLSYYNQPDHGVIDRKNPEVVEILCRLTRAEARRGTEGRSAEEQYGELLRASGSSLERAWLDYLRTRGYRLPDRAQFVLDDFFTRPDFGYRDSQALIYIDGPHHERDAQRTLDRELTRSLEDAGYLVIRFPKEQDRWPDILHAHPEVFGRPER